MNLKTVLEVSEILFDKRYNLERAYSKIDDQVYIEYTIREDGKKLLVSHIEGSYRNFDKLIDYMDEYTIKVFKHAVSRN